KTSCSQSKPVFSVLKYLQKHGNWQLQLIPNVGNCNWKKTRLWFSPVQSYAGPANTS
ncbi:hypothetical protein K443DRAFT_102204, partial [Laccaria amethystina LaAM-08-1]